MEREDSAETILITGATGNVGREVVIALHGAGAVARSAILKEQDRARLPRESDEAVFFEFGKEETYAPAFDGVSKLFLMRPPQISDIETYIKPVIDFAANSGVEQIVFLSLIGVETKSYVPHYKVEKFLEASGVPYTFLRCGFFMQNLNTTHRLDIVEHDDIFIPAGDAKTAFIDTRDIGAVAAHALTTGGHHNRAYELTGSEALHYDEVAEIFTEVLGRKIRYSRPGMLKFARRMKKRGYPLGFVIVTSLLYFATRRGSAEKITTDVQALLGREPIKLRQYVQDYAETWQKA